jgi:hypothetical protein
MFGQEAHVFQGLKRDVSPIRQEASFLWDAENIRVTDRGDGTATSVTSEKGNTKVDLQVGDKLLGHCVIGEYLVLFVKNSKNEIIRIDSKGNQVTLYSGDLNFHEDYPIETLGVHEAELVQKIYWVDGRNQPRVINITKRELTGKDDCYSGTSPFDFVSTLQLDEIVSVERLPLGGTFAPGIVQYAFTYYNKYGQESNIFYITPQIYITDSDRGSKPEEICANSFNITITGLDNFDFIRIYAIHRSSLGAEPTVRLVTDLSIDTEVSYIDNGVTGESVDPTQLLYMGGEQIIASTMAAKDGTLFLGNIETIRRSIPEDIKAQLLEDSESCLITGFESIELPKTSIGTYYSYYHQLTNQKISYLKAGEHYRLGLQFQHESGQWSEPVVIHKDYTIPTTAFIDYSEEEDEDDSVDIDISGSQKPKSDSTSYSSVSVLPNRPSINGNILTIPRLKYKGPTKPEIGQKLRDLGYKKVRAVVVFPTNERKIVAQGILCPTVFNYKDRKDDNIYAQSSWIFRPNTYSELIGANEAVNNQGYSTVGYSFPEFRHLHALPRNDGRSAEIQSNESYTIGAKVINEVTAKFLYDEFQTGEDEFIVDQNIVTLHSPDIQFNTEFAAGNRDGLKLRIIGTTPINSSINDISITTSSPVFGAEAVGVIEKQWGISGALEPTITAGRYISGSFYRDAIVKKSSKNNPEQPNNYIDNDYLVYMWHRTGSLNSDYNRGDENGARSAVLKHKVISTMLFSKDNRWWDMPAEYSISTPQYWGDTTISAKIDGSFYSANVDTMVTKSDSYQIRFRDKSRGTTNYYAYEADNSYADYTSNEPIRMKYQSCPHAVFKLTSPDSSKEVILPRLTMTKASEVKEYNKANSDATVQEAFFVGDANGKTYQSALTLKSVVLSPSHIGLVFDKEYNTVYTAYFKAYYNEYNGYGDRRIDYIGYKGKEELLGTVFKYIDLKANNGDLLPKYIRLTKLAKMGADGVEYEEEGGGYKYEEVDDGYLNHTRPVVTIKQDAFNYYDDKKPYLLIGELYRDDISTSFGGDSESAMIYNNIWIPASDSYVIGSYGFTLPFEYGDTYYQRYDCMKTYPSSSEDPNSLVEIGSFMCETRVNLDGRCDINRGANSNIDMSPTNFNIMNDVYSQQDNFFTYRMMDSDYYKQVKYPNQVVFTKEKSNASEVDTWTNLTLTSSLDLDGSKGTLTSLNTCIDSLIALQEKAVSLINFNSRVQIPTADNVPIEISNNYKVDGYRFISDQVGCQNKLSVCKTPMGIYFIDNINKSIYRFNSEGLSELSTTAGVNFWVRENEAVKTYYDSIYKDIYFTVDSYDTCQTLGYSELTGTFVSKYSYDGVDAMFNFNDKFYSYYKGSIWEMFTKNDTDIFGELRNNKLTFVANENPLYTKIFDTIEFKTDIFGESGITHAKPFQEIWAKNEYQESAVGSDFKYKFRIWRGLIPRAPKMQRIRNPWTFITLNRKDKGKLVLHDLSVKYTY